MEYQLNVKQLREYATKFNAGDRVILSGTVYTARDAAHSRIISALDDDSVLPFNLNNAVIYYAGPTPAPLGLAVGACGPTTSSRMDVFTPRLFDKGIAAVIGKGERNKTVCESIEKNKGVYLCAIGGAGALASKCITKCDVIAYEDLGCESVKKLCFKDFPLIVAVDCSGGNIFDRTKQT